MAAEPTRKFAQKTLKEHPLEVSLGTFARGATTNFFGSAYYFVSSLAFNLIIARLLGPDQLGLYFLALNVGTLLAWVAIGGYGDMLLRYLARLIADQDWSAFRGVLQFGIGAIVAGGLLFGFGLAITAPWIAHSIFHKPELTTPLQVVAVAVPLTALELALLYVTQAFKKMKPKMWIESVVNPTLKIGFTVIFVWLGGGLYSVFGAYLLALSVCTLLALRAMYRSLPVGLERHVPSCQPQALLAYATPLLGVNLLALIMRQADLYVLAYFRPLEEVGIYALCKRLFDVARGVGSQNIVTQIFVPFASELHYLGQRGRLALFYKVSTLWGVELFLPILAAGTAGAWAVTAIFGEAYGPAAPILMLLLAGQLAFALGGPAGEVLSMAGKTRLLFLDSCIVLATQLGLGILLIPRWGLMGAATVSVATLTSAKLIQVLQVHHHQQIHPWSVWLLKPLSAGLVALFAAFLVSPLAGQSTYIYLSLLGTTVLLSYGGMLVILGFDEPSRLAWQQLRGSLRRRTTTRGPILRSEELL